MRAIQKPKKSFAAKCKSFLSSLTKISNALYEYIFGTMKKQANKVYEEEIAQNSKVQGLFLIKNY